MSTPVANRPGMGRAAPAGRGAMDLLVEYGPDRFALEIKRVRTRDALESVVNLAGAMFGLAMVVVASRPADDGHPYGHHKAEYFSSGFEGILIVGAALGIIWAAAHRFFDPEPLQQLGLGLALSIVSSGLNGLLAWVMLKAADEHRSMALRGDARHLITDVWTSVGVVVGFAGIGRRCRAG